MVSRGRQLTEIWDAHKEELTVMALQTLTNIKVNIHWNDRPEVSEGRVLTSNFTMPRLSAMTDGGKLCTHSKRAPPKREANPVLENGAWHIVLKDISFPPGSTSTAQVARLATRSRANPALPASPPRFVPHRDAPSRSRSLRIYGDNAHRAPAARRDVRNAPAPQILQAVPKRCITRYRLQPALQAGAVKPCEDTPASWRRLTMS